MWLRLLFELRPSFGNILMMVSVLPHEPKWNEVKMKGRLGKILLMTTQKEVTMLQAIFL